MATMVCSRCQRTGIYWCNLGGLMVAYTYCPHCESRQWPIPEPSPTESEDSEDSDGELIEIRRDKEKK